MPKLKKGLAFFEKHNYIERAVQLTDARKEVMCLHFVYPNLVSTMEKHGLDYKGLADILGISEHAAYRRLRGFAGWKLPEAFLLRQYFGICDIDWLFQCNCK